MPSRNATARSTILTFCLAFALCGQDDPIKQIDGIFQPWNNAKSPGAAVSVIQQGHLLFEKGYGVANLEYNIPIKTDTIFHVASVSKQFTAMAIILLERDAKLTIDDEIRWLHAGCGNRCTGLRQAIPGILRRTYFQTARHVSYPLPHGLA